MTFIALLDCNNFFVSCERVFRPDLNNKPIVVLSNNDGCVISRSNEAKAAGIPMGAPWFKVNPILESHQATVFSSNFTLYGDLSARVMALVNSFVPDMEIYSIDEAFLNLTLVSAPLETSVSIRNAILQSLGIPTCIGISKTKVLAKVANHFAKKYPAFKGVCLLETEQQIAAALKLVDIDDLWGIGRRLSMRLKKVGIKTAFDLQQVDPRWMRQHCTVIGERIVQELRGIPCYALKEGSSPKKSIQVSRSFSSNISSYEDLRQNVAAYATRLAVNLRQENLKAKMVMVYIRTNRHRKDLPTHQESFLVNLAIEANDDATLIKACTKGLKSIYRPGHAYKKAGVMAFELVSPVRRQYSLFANEEKERGKVDQVAKVMDNLNRRFGRGTVHMAACVPKLSWRNKKDKKSPAYTTSWTEIPVVLAK